jgi:DNA-binding LytR/AlgR family response regulator
MTAKLKVLLVDDNALHRSKAAFMLHTNIPDIDICASVATVQESVYHLRHDKPDILISAVVLPDGTLLDILMQLYKSPELWMLQTIAVSAPEQYHTMLTLFGVNAFIAQPYTQQEFHVIVRHCCQRVIDHRQLQTARMLLPKLNEIYEPLPAWTDEPQMLEHLIKHNPTLRQNVVILEGQGDYTLVHLLHDAPRLLTKRISDWVLPLQFQRVHRSYIVNTLYVMDWKHKGKDAVLRMWNGSEVIVARSYKDAVLEHLKAVQALIHGTDGMRGLFQ